jgi:putative transposase
LEQPRASQRYVGKKAAKDAAMIERMAAIAGENPRYGYRRVWALLKREGWAVNKKRVQRLWREADLKVPQKQHRDGEATMRAKTPIVTGTKNGVRSLPAHTRKGWR